MGVCIRKRKDESVSKNDRINKLEEVGSFRMEEERRKSDSNEGMEEYVYLTYGRGRMEVYDV
jgi:hypothetical protein